MILFYAFSNPWATNISLRTLVEIEHLLPHHPKIVFRRINGYPHQFFAEYIKNKTYTLIIGLGDNQTFDPRIRLETQAANRYGRHSILPLAPATLKLDLPYLENIDTNNFIISENMGKFYNCNWIAYKIQSYINQKKLPVFHFFFHLSLKSVDKNNAALLVNLLKANQMLQ